MGLPLDVEVDMPRHMIGDALRVWVLVVYALSCWFVPGVWYCLSSNQLRM